jgi:hypothetical protein
VLGLRLARKERTQASSLDFTNDAHAVVAIYGIPLTKQVNQQLSVKGEALFEVLPRLVSVFFFG